MLNPEYHALRSKVLLYPEHHWDLKYYYIQNTTKIWSIIIFRIPLRFKVLLYPEYHWDLEYY